MYLVKAAAFVIVLVTGCTAGLPAVAESSASVVDFETGATHHSQSLVWSVRSGWRRRTSLLWNALHFRRMRTSPLLRISIHPVDRHHPKIWQQIGELVSRALADREPLTYHAWLLRQRAAAF